MEPLTKELGKMEEESKNKNHVYITHYQTLQEFSIVKLLSNNKVSGTKSLIVQLIN